MSSAPRLRALYVCYLSLDDPLVHTQVIAYLRGLSHAGHHIHLLTFETRRIGRAERTQRRAQLAAEGIAWHHRRYHKTPTLPATVYDTLAGALHAAVLIRRHRLNAFHARNHVPAAMWLALTRVTPRRFHPRLIFDVRGLMAEEYRDAGRWTEDSLPFRLTKAVERAALGAADAVIVLTERAREHLFDGPVPKVTVIPCCVDSAGTEAPAGARERVRRRLGIGDVPVMVYVGKFTGWYMEAEMAAFFAALWGQLPEAHFLVLTQAEPELIARELAAQGVGTDAVTITSAPHDAVGEHLSAADFAISFIEPAPSKLASSPTKVGEYLAAGLPVLSTAGVGDLDTLLSSDVGVLVDAHTPEAYAAALASMLALVVDPGTPDRCRAVARGELSLSEVGWPRYRAVYARVAARAAQPRSPGGTGQTA